MMVNAADDGRVEANPVKSDAFIAEYKSANNFQKRFFRLLIIQ